MRKLILLLTLTTAILTSCSKSDEPKPETVSLTGTKWESFYFKGSLGQDYTKRLNFTSSTQVEYFITWQNPTTPTSVGKSVLNYTFDGKTTHITGTLNGFSGEVGKGDKVDYKLTYTPVLGSAKASLNGGDDYYMPY